MKRRSNMTRVSAIFKKEVINYIRAKYLLAGKRPPTAAEITQMIANDRRILNIIQNELIPL